MSTPDPVEVADVLDGAADLIAEHGLARKALVDDYGSYCAIGAINVAANQPHLNHANVYYTMWSNPADAKNRLARAVLARYLGYDERQDGSRDGVIFKFNDFPLRRRRTVIKTLRAAAAKVRAEAAKRSPKPDPQPVTQADLALAAGESQ